MYKNIIIVLSVIFTLNCKADGAFFYENLHGDSQTSLLVGSKTENLNIDGRPLQVTWNCSGLWDYSSGLTWETGAKFISGNGNKVHILPKKPTWFDLNSTFRKKDIPYIIIEVNKKC
ncbi:hypothetical protein [Pseudoalteromonas sp. H105]|uniref:hypothetical protein n=1 Tax=Pseudoalteromonas sp. H105 TaxID=1348393 RepID=UPI0007322921|nr:hypothetical protein [Pseudoalteromonas sp. H105]KTF12218.1 hypothetical protein ATS75_18430 [Pseudoalteromonas sp. H105]